MDPLIFYHLLRELEVGKRGPGAARTEQAYYERHAGWLPVMAQKPWPLRAMFSWLVRLYAFKWLTSPAVEASSPSTPRLPSITGCRPVASSLPNSTPH